MTAVLENIFFKSLCLYRVCVYIFYSIAVFCLEPPIINNGGFRLSTNSTVAGTVVEYYCLTNSRYRMSGPSRIVCQSDGHYDQDPPVCIGKFGWIISFFFSVFWTPFCSENKNKKNSRLLACPNVLFFHFLV